MRERLVSALGDADGHKGMVATQSMTMSVLTPRGRRGNCQHHAGLIPSGLDASISLSVDNDRAFYRGKLGLSDGNHAAFRKIGEGGDVGELNTTPSAASITSATENSENDYTVNAKRHNAGVDLTIDRERLLSQLAAGERLATMANHLGWEEPVHITSLTPQAVPSRLPSTAIRTGAEYLHWMCADVLDPTSKAEGARPQVPRQHQQRERGRSPNHAARGEPAGGERRAFSAESAAKFKRKKHLGLHRHRRPPLGITPAGIREGAFSSGGPSSKKRSRAGDELVQGRHVRGRDSFESSFSSGGEHAGLSRSRSFVVGQHCDGSLEGSCDTRIGLGMALLDTLGSGGAHHSFPRIKVSRVNRCEFTRLG